jgi:glycosyltransferase involved in cell wall biosynthesis
LNMNILIVASEVDISLPEAAAVKLTAQTEVFLNQGHDVFLIAQASGRVPDIFKNRSHFTGCKSALKLGILHPLYTLLTEFRASMIIRRRAKWIDIVYQRALPTSFAGPYGKRTYKTPLVLEFNSNLLSQLRFVYPLVFRVSGMSALSKKRWIDVLDKGDKIICVSPGQINELTAAGISSDKIAVIPNGVDVNRFSPSIGQPPNDAKLRSVLDIMEGHRVITHVGSSVFYDYDAMMSVISEVAGQMSNAFLLIVGEGKEKQRFEKRVKTDSRLRELVCFAGLIPNEHMPYILKNSDALLILPKKSEENKLSGLSPVKLFEYMAMGKPIVARDDDAGSICNLLGGSGMAIKNAGVDEMAKAILQILRDEALASKLGKAAREQAMPYAWENNVRSHLGIYEELMQERGKSS